MITHETRRESHLKVDKAKRQGMILDAYRRCGAMTAREVGYKLGFQDLNAVKPRITELCEMGKLKATGKKYDPITDRNVTVYEIVEGKR